MNSYVQLKDNVVFATLNTSGDILESDSIIKVDVNPDSLLNKKYENGNFVDAEIIKYALLDGNTVVQINKTLYSSEVSGPVINDNLVQVLWTWDGEKFNAPILVEPTVIINENIIQNTPEPTPEPTES